MITHTSNNFQQFKINAYVFLYSIPIGQKIFLASYLRFGRVFPSVSISFNNWSNYVKLLSVNPFIAFKFINLNTVDNRVKSVDPDTIESLHRLTYFHIHALLQKTQLQHHESCPPIDHHVLHHPWWTEHILGIRTLLVNLIIHHAMSKLYKIVETHTPCMDPPWSRPLPYW